MNKESHYFECSAKNNIYGTTKKAADRSLLVGNKRQLVRLFRNPNLVVKNFVKNRNGEALKFSVKQEGANIDNGVEMDDTGRESNNEGDLNEIEGLQDSTKTRGPSDRIVAPSVRKGGVELNQLPLNNVPEDADIISIHALPSGHVCIAFHQPSLVAGKTIDLRI